MMSFEELKYKYLIKWSEYEDIYITDIAEKSFELVLEFVFNGIYANNHVYDVLGVWEEEGGIEMFKRYLRHIIRNECSVMAISKDRLKLFGVGLMLRTTHEWRSWANMQNITNSRGIFNEVINMHRLLHTKATRKKGLADNDYDAMVLHQVVMEDAVGKDLKFMAAFFAAFGESSRHMQMTRLTYIGMSQTDQKLLRAIRWNDITRIFYSIYMIGKERLFDCLRTAGELNAVLFEWELLPLVPFLEMPGYEEIHKQAMKRKL